jgi:MFS family permease
MGAGTAGVFAFVFIALGVVGLMFAPFGALLPELFPTELRYTGAAGAYNLGGIVGGSLAPFLAQILISAGGLAYVGHYVALAAAVSFASLATIAETRDADLNAAH